MKDKSMYIVLAREVFMDFLKRAQDGEDIDMLWIEFFANTERGYTDSE